MTRSPSRFFAALAQHGPSLNRLQATLLAGIAGLVCLCLLEIVWPPRPQHVPAMLGAALPEESPADPTAGSDWLAVLKRRNLFEPAVPLPSRRIARESVDRIIGALSLKAIMKAGDQYVAYIQVKGVGLKRFSSGQGLDEMFRVLRIGPDSVELDVVGERIKLES